MRARYQMHAPVVCGMQGLAVNGGQVHIFVQEQHVISKYRGHLSETQVDAYQEAVALVRQDLGALEAAAGVLQQAGFEVMIV